MVLHQHLSSTMEKIDIYKKYISEFSLIILVGISEYWDALVSFNSLISVSISLKLTSLKLVASLSLFYRYYFGRCSPGLAQLVPLPFSRCRPTRYSDRSHDFSVTIPRCYKDVYIDSFFPCTVRLWNYLPIGCFL